MKVDYPCGNLLKKQLMRVLFNHRRRCEWSQTQMAEQLQVTQSRVSTIEREQVHLFTLDALIEHVNRLGYRVQLQVQPPQPPK